MIFRYFVSDPRSEFQYICVESRNLLRGISNKLPTTPPPTGYSNLCPTTLFFSMVEKLAKAMTNHFSRSLNKKVNINNLT